MKSLDPETENRIRFALIVILITSVLFINRGIVMRFTGRDPLSFGATPRAVTARGDLALDEKATNKIFESVSPSVVHVTTLQRVVKRRLRGLASYDVPEGTGTGFIWDDDGHIVTNYHVIEKMLLGGGKCKVTLKDHSTWDANVIGVAPDMDLAVLRIDAPKNQLKPIPIGTSRDLLVGQKVFAIGNPFGFDQTLTAGIVSALGRQIESVTDAIIQDVIMTDAAINPGNSGGPLLDSAGRLIGVNTAIQRYAQNMSFAVPVDTVNRQVPLIIGRSVRQWIGVTLVRKDLAAMSGFDRGVIVAQVFDETPARDAGMLGIERLHDGWRVFDIILEVDGRSVDSNKEFQETIDRHEVGESVELSVLRDGKLRIVQVEVQALR